MLKRNRGSSFVYVITAVAFLAILSTGFFYMTAFNTNTAMDIQRTLQQQYLAKSVHRSVCLAVENGELDVLNEFLESVYEADFEPELTEWADDVCWAGTGETVMELSNGDLVTIAATLNCERLEERIEVILDTFVSFSDTAQYQFSALLVPADELDENRKWTVVRHFDKRDR